MPYQCMFVVEEVNTNVCIAFAMTAISHDSWNIIQVEGGQHVKHNILVTSILTSSKIITNVAMYIFLMYRYLTDVFIVLIFNRHFIQRHNNFAIH